MSQVDYFISLNSPWTYLGSRRFADIVEDRGAQVTVKPAKFGQVFEKTGGLPLNRRSPERRAYRMMELKRWRDHLGVPLVLEPRSFPCDETEGVRHVLACGLVAGHDRALALANAIGASLWEMDQDIADPQVLAEAGKRAGVDIAAIRSAAPSNEALDAMWDRNTSEAIVRGVFGAPSYVLQSGEIFWGQDRLEFLDRALAT